MVLNCAAIYCQISSIHMNQQTCKSVRFCSLYKGSLCQLSSHWSILPDTFLWLANSSLSIISSVSFGIELPVAKSRTILALVVRSNWLSSKLPSHWFTLTSPRPLIGQWETPFISSGRSVVLGKTRKTWVYSSLPLDTIYQTSMIKMIQIYACINH